MPVCLGVGLVFGSGAVAHYKSIIKLRFYLLFSPLFFPTPLNFLSSGINTALNAILLSALLATWIFFPFPFLCLLPRDTRWLSPPPLASYRCSCFQVAVVAPHIQIKLICTSFPRPLTRSPLPLRISPLKQTLCSPLPGGDGLGTPAVQLIPPQPALAALSECDEALLGKRLLLGVTCQQKRGRAGTHSEGEHNSTINRPPTLPLASRVVRLSESHQRGGNVGQVACTS